MMEGWKDEKKVECSGMVVCEYSRGSQAGAI
jgi:hypothetical protein